MENKTAAEIAKEIFFLPATNNQAETSIAHGTKLIEAYAQYRGEPALKPDSIEAADNWVKSLDSYMSDYPTTDHVAHRTFIAGANWQKEQTIKLFKERISELEIKKALSKGASKSILQARINELTTILSKYENGNS